MTDRLVEHIFFFALLAGVGYVIWEMFVSFAGALALAAILATVSYPLYERILRFSPKHNKSLAAIISVFLVILIVLLPLSLIAYLLLQEAADFYTMINNGSLLSVERVLIDVEAFLHGLFPNASINVVDSIADFAAQAARNITSNLGSIFTSTASTIFLLFISLIALFYFFRDGKEFTRSLIYASPLPDSDDERILNRLSQAIRSVILGVLTVALIQGVLTAIGLSIFGIEQAVLLGSIAAVGALIPGIGTSIVFVPTIIVLAVTGSYGPAIGLTLWGLFAVGFVDNLLGPYLISRGAPLHPFFILLSVLGGLVFFGPVGFVLGPVMLSLFKVLLELYSDHVQKTS